MSVDEDPMVIGMFDAINSSCGKTEVDQVEVHGKLIIELVHVETHYQTARSYVGIAIRELFNLHAEGRGRAIHCGNSDLV